MTIVRLLLAFFADGVMESVAATRRSYLLEVERYLDERCATSRSVPRRASD